MQSSLDILDRLKSLRDVLDTTGIDRIYYGAYAYYLYTGEQLDIDDIDVMIHNKDFDKLIVALLISKLNFDVERTDHSMYVYLHEWKNDKDELIKISFDSYEHYFKRYGIKMSKYNDEYFKRYGLRIIPKEELIRVYKLGLEKAVEEKRGDYRRKLDYLRFGKD
jgi:hypothetical protein